MTELLTLDEAADLLHMSPNTLRYYRQQKTGPQGFRLGRRVMFDRSEVERWLDEQRHTGAAERGPA